jgi:hypothetical protein
MCRGALISCCAFPMSPFTHARPCLIHTFSIPGSAKNRSSNAIGKCLANPARSGTQSTVACTLLQPSRKCASFLLFCFVVVGIRRFIENILRFCRRSAARAWCTSTLDSIEAAHSIPRNTRHNSLRPHHPFLLLTEKPYPYASFRSSLSRHCFEI